MNERRALPAVKAILSINRSKQVYFKQAQMKSPSTLKRRKERLKINLR